MFDAQILADSISPVEARLTTFQVTFPRFILAEVNTHRMLSRNSASSRAIPLKKQLAMLAEDPFTPRAFPKEQKGMSGGDHLTGDAEIYARKTWRLARDNAMAQAQALSELGVHKSLCNRLIEPFMWHTAIITGTDWSNFFALRTDKEAQPEFRTIAVMMQEIMAEGVPTPLTWDEWHTPLVSRAERLENKWDWQMAIEVSAGRCARVSYLTHDGVRDPGADVDLHDRLINNGHMSPTEHQAQPMYDPTKYYGNLRGFMPYRKLLPYEDDFSKKLAADALIDA